MKLSCTQENLNTGLNYVSHIASKNISLPILNNVLLKADKSGLNLSTTNLEIGITCIIRAKIEQEGNFTVQAKTLSDYVGLLSKEKIDLELTGQDLKIQSKNSKTIMKGMDASEFPIIPDVEGGDTFEVEAKKFKLALSNVSFAVAFDEARPEISGVLFNFNSRGLTLAATDSYRLAEKFIKLEKSSPQEHSVIVPIKTIQELVRILSDEGLVSITTSENQILFSFSEVRLISRIIEGQYPDYKQIIPKEQGTTAVISTQELIKTIKSASLFCRPGINDITVKLDPQNGLLTASAANVQLGENETTQESEIKGEENTIVFNSRYLLDGLQNIETEESVLEVVSSTNPGVLRPKDKDDYLYIIMPIKQ